VCVCGVCVCVVCVWCVCVVCVCGMCVWCVCVCGVYLSYCSHETTRIQLEGFLLNLTQIFSKICREDSRFISCVPGNFVRVVGVSTNSFEDIGQRERGSGGGSPLIRGSGGNCNLVQEISFHIVNLS